MEVFLVGATRMPKEMMESSMVGIEVGVDLRNLLIVIFPPLENLEEEITHNFRHRVMLRDDAQFVKH